MSFDIVSLARDLIRCPSITPVDAGALDVLTHSLQRLGFTCHRLVFKGDNGPETQNLFAHIGTGSPHFCFAGHTDVVPAGEEASWQYPPFEGYLDKDGFLYGRGAVDMKGAIASFVGAVDSFLTTFDVSRGTLSLMITGDEEGTAINGTPKILKWLKDKNINIDFCLVGEPTSCKHLGDTIKIGRRGSLNGTLKTRGVQGHVAFPERSKNPIPCLLACATALNQGPRETASPYFEPTNVELTSVDVGNQTVNLIPEEATAQFNIRFSDQQTPASLETWLETVCQKNASTFSLETSLSGEAEMLTPGPETDLLERSLEKSLNVKATLSTKGATSDARFIRHYAPVLELGLVGETMHQVNERVSVKDLCDLQKVYQEILHQFFKTFSGSSTKDI
tara:strand:+ start:1159 stop:2334 length:1176 start_codon:yes stop_codon:yes gene_type:complete